MTLGTTKTAEVRHRAVLPNKWIECGNPCAGVRRETGERVPGYLPLLVDPQGTTFGTAQGSQFLQPTAVLPNECPHFGWHGAPAAFIHEERTGYTVQSKSDYLTPVID